MQTTTTFLLKQANFKQSNANYVFGCVFIGLGLLFFFKASFRNLYYWFPFLFILLGFSRIFQNFFTPYFSAEKYISLNENLITIKKGYKREVKFLNHEIQAIALKSSDLSLKTSKGEFDFNISEISFKDRQKLKELLTILCQNTAIELK